LGKGERGKGKGERGKGKGEGGKGKGERVKGKGERVKGKGERVKVSNTSDLLHSILFALLLSKGCIFIGERENTKPFSLFPTSFRSLSFPDFS